MLLSKAIETRVHQSCVQGLFKSFVVECQGRAALANQSFAFDFGTDRLVMAIGDVHGTYSKNQDNFETLSRAVVDASFEQLRHSRSLDWSRLEKLTEESGENYLGVALTVVFVECYDDNFDQKRPFSVHIQQLGACVDIWCMRNRDFQGEDESSKNKSLERWSSKIDDRSSIPHCVATKERTNEFAYYPLDSSLGAAAFRSVRHNPTTKRFLVHSGDLIFFQTNRFEQDTNRDAVFQWLPWRLNREFDEKNDYNWLNVLDSEICAEFETTQNRLLSVLCLCKEDQSAATSFYGRGTQISPLYKSIRAGKYVPGGDAFFEAAFARHCKHLGADKLKMIALYLQQCGAMAGTHVDETYLERVCDTMSESGGANKEGEEGEEEGDEGEDDEYEWFYKAKTK